MRARYLLQLDGAAAGTDAEAEIEVEALAPGRYRVRLGERELVVERRGGTAAAAVVLGPGEGPWDGVATRIHPVEVGGRWPQLSAAVGDFAFGLRVEEARRRLVQGRAGRAGPGGSAVLRAPMPGRVIKLLAQPGQTVEGGQGLVVIEAMKMENELKAPHAGTVKEIQVAEGASVEAGTPLLMLEG